MTEEVINEEEITVAQPWRDAMNRQVHNIIVSTLEASETMLEELDPDSDPEELHIELIAVALSAVAAMGGISKENFMEMAKSAAQEYLDEEEEDDA
jgi:capsid portal protein